MKICIISYDYPDDRRSSFAFVKQIVEEFVRQGHDCCVIAPYSVTSNKRLIKYETFSKSNSGSLLVLRPHYLSFSNFNFWGFHLSNILHKHAVDNALRKMNFNPDVMYAHFWQSAIEGYSYAREKNIPLFVATGESKINISNLGVITQDFVQYVSGVICVSTKNMYESIELGLTHQHKCKVIPNSIDSNLFKKLNKLQCRLELNIPHNSFVVAFVGWFNERKGAKRVSDAIDRLSDNDILSIFIGQGNENPDCHGILYKGPLKHNQIPQYLNAADVFVLPTLREGCCNAVVEAMACGLPIISSNRPFNTDILDDSNAILIEPDDIDEISDAIFRLKNESILRETMSRNSLMKSQNLTIDVRVQKILEFISQMIRK